MNREVGRLEFMIVLVCLLGLATPGLAKDQEKAKSNQQQLADLSKGHAWYGGAFDEHGDNLDPQIQRQIIEQTEREHRARGGYMDDAGNMMMFGGKNGQVVTKEQFIQEGREQDEWFKNVNRASVGYMTQGVTPGASKEDQALERKAIAGTIASQEKLERDVDKEQIRREQELKKYEVPKVLVSREKGRKNH